MRSFSINEVNLQVIKQKKKKKNVNYTVKITFQSK